jgi:hypothetical protein
LKQHLASVSGLDQMPALKTLDVIQSLSLFAGKVFQLTALGVFFRLAADAKRVALGRSSRVGGVERT